MQYKCKLCGAVFEVEDGQEAVCPLCGATGDQLVPVTKKAAGDGITPRTFLRFHHCRNRCCRGWKTFLLRYRTFLRSA